MIHRLVPGLMLLCAVVASCRDQQAPMPGTAPGSAPVASGVVALPMATAPANSADPVVPSLPAAAASSSAFAPTTVTACEDLVKAENATLPRPAGHRARGVDASMPAAWKSLKEQGVSFAFAQAVYGTTANASFEANWSMMKSCGLVRGAYDFITPQSPGAQQAELFLKTVGSDLGEVGPFVDVERPAGCKGPCCGVSCDGWTTVVADWISAVSRATGRKPVVYTVEDFWKECVCNKSRFALHDLWLAGYPRFDFPERPGFGGWQKWLFYQHAGNVRFGGSVVDLNVFRGTEPELRALVPSTVPGRADAGTR